MGAFTIYALVITVFYVLYMTAAGTMDLIGKKGGHREESEEIVTSEVSEEEDTTIIREEEDGYSMRRASDVNGEEATPEEGTEGSSYDSPVEPSAAVGSEGEVSVPDESFDEYEDKPYDDGDALLEEESAESLEEYERIKAIQEQMEDTQPFYQEEYTSSDFSLALCQPLEKKTNIYREIINV